jgi:hypothetical protein
MSDSRLGATRRFERLATRATRRLGQPCRPMGTNGPWATVRVSMADQWGPIDHGQRSESAWPTNGDQWTIGNGPSQRGRPMGTNGPWATVRVSMADQWGPSWQRSESARSSWQRSESARRSPLTHQAREAGRRPVWTPTEREEMTGVDQLRGSTHRHFLKLPVFYYPSR